MFGERAQKDVNKVNDSYTIQASYTYLIAVIVIYIYFVPFYFFLVVHDRIRDGTAVIIIIDSTEPKSWVRAHVDSTGPNTVSLHISCWLKRATNTHNIEIQTKHIVIITRLVIIITNHYHYPRNTVITATDHTNDSEVHSKLKVSKNVLWVVASSVIERRQRTTYRFDRWQAALCICSVIPCVRQTVPNHILPNH